MNSQPEWVTFSWWTYSLCERSTQRDTGIQDSHWDVVQCWDLREVGEMPWWVHTWIQFSSLGVRKCPYILNQLSDPEFFRKCTEMKRKLGDTVLCNAKAYYLNTLLRYKTEEVYIKWILHKTDIFLFSSVHFNQSVMSYSLRTHESLHTRPPCPSPAPGVHLDSCPSSQWCQPAVSSSVVPFSFFPQYLPASESFPMSLLFAWGGQSTGVSAFSIIPSKEIPGLISFRRDWLDLLAVQGTLSSLLQHHILKTSILQHSAFFTVQLSHPYMTIGKTIPLTRP